MRRNTCWTRSFRRWEHQLVESTNGGTNAVAHEDSDGLCRMKSHPQIKGYHPETFHQGFIWRLSHAAHVVDGVVETGPDTHHLDAA